MIYLDTSVALAHLLAEDRSPPGSLWERTLVSSRLLQYELWVRLNSRHLEDSHGEAARALLGRVDFIEMVPSVLTRVSEPFPLPVRTLDAIHLASMCFLRDQGQSVTLATYDLRLASVAVALGIQQEMAA